MNPVGVAVDVVLALTAALAEAAVDGRPGPTAEGC
jgi:hypothetical protein